MAGWPQRRRTPVTGLQTQEMVSLIGIAASNGARARRVVGVEATGINACPCAQDLVRGQAAERLAAAGFGEDAERILELVPLATHNQRGRGTLLVGTAAEPRRRGSRWHRRALDERAGLRAPEAAGRAARRRASPPASAFRRGLRPRRSRGAALDDARPRRRRLRALTSAEPRDDPRPRRGRGALGHGRRDPGRARRRPRRPRSRRRSRPGSEPDEACADGGRLRHGHRARRRPAGASPLHPARRHPFAGVARRRRGVYDRAVRAHREAAHAAPAPVTFPLPATATTSPSRSGAKRAATERAASSLTSQRSDPVHAPDQRTKRWPPPASGSSTTALPASQSVPHEAVQSTPGTSLPTEPRPAIASVSRICSRDEAQPQRVLQIRPAARVAVVVVPPHVEDQRGERRAGHGERIEDVGLAVARMPAGVGTGMRSAVRERPERVEELVGGDVRRRDVGACAEIDHRDAIAPRRARALAAQVGIVDRPVVVDEELLVRRPPGRRRRLSLDAIAADGRRLERRRRVGETEGEDVRLEAARNATRSKRGSRAGSCASHHASMASTSAENCDASSALRSPPSEGYA